MSEAEAYNRSREEWKRGITARLLRNYANALEKRLERGEVCIDSDLHHVLLRAAMLLETYCPAVIRHEKERKALLGGDKKVLQCNLKSHGS